ncbi:MAG: hypothetical protein ACLU8Q_13445 [Oscillospiraceae bacterium]
MSYVKTNWKDHVLSNNNYTLKNNTDGTYSINPAGEIVQQGTPMSADNFNHLEQGVYDADKNAADALSKIGSGNAAGSITPGGAAASAEKLTSDAGASREPIYFENGVPKVCQYALGSMCSKDANDYSKANHTHDYLPLSGGTMEPDSEIVIPYGTTGRAAGLGKNGVRVYTTSNGSPWASGVSFYKTDKEASLGAIGAYGHTDTLEYYYIGSYQNPAVKITPDGKITTAASGNLLYSGAISIAGGSVTIQDLASYSVVLLQTYGVGANGLSCGITTLIPIAYISKGNSIRLYGGIPSSSYITSSGPQAAKDMGGYITASMTSDSPSILTLEQSVGIIGNIQIYSII